MFNRVGRKWSIRNSAWLENVWKPLSLTHHEITGIENGNIAIIRTSMTDMEGKTMPGSEILAQFPRQEMILRPFRFWIEPELKVTAERRENCQCPVGNFDCWVSEFVDPAQKNASGTFWASMQFPGLIVREQRRYTAEELDEKTNAVLSAREMFELKELVAFSG